VQKRTRTMNRVKRRIERGRRGITTDREKRKSMPDSSVFSCPWALREQKKEKRTKLRWGKVAPTKGGRGEREMKVSLRREGEGKVSACQLYGPTTP